MGLIMNFIGKYVKALKNNPQGNDTIKIGDVGIVISQQDDFALDLCVYWNKMIDITGCNDTLRTRDYFKSISKDEFKTGHIWWVRKMEVEIFSAPNSQLEFEF